MKVKFKYIIYISLIIIAVSIFFKGCYIYRNMHHSDWETCNKYLWLFNDSVKDKIDPNLKFSYVKKTDIYNHFIYKKYYMITIWEFMELSSVDLKSIPIKESANIPDLDIMYGKGEVFNPRINPEINLRYESTFNNGMQICVDKNSTIIKRFESINFKGFYGTINRMLLTDGNNKGNILFKYIKENTSVMVLLVKTLKSFYLIIVESNNPAYKVDEEIINIFNLEKV